MTGPPERRDGGEEEGRRGEGREGERKEERGMSTCGNGAVTVTVQTQNSGGGDLDSIL